jgi:hypothetical protein
MIKSRDLSFIIDSWLENVERKFVLNVFPKAKVGYYSDDTMSGGFFGYLSYFGIRGNEVMNRDKVA